MISIVFVIPTLDQSGAERQLMLLATHLPKDEYRVHVIALNRGGPYADQLRQHGIEVDILQKRFRCDPLSYLRLRRRLHELKPDIVQSFLFAANSYIRLPGVVPPRCRVIVSERCVDSWKSAWQLKMDRRLLKHTDAMTANSQAVAEFYCQQVGVPDSLLTVIPNAVASSATPPSKETRTTGRLRQELELNDAVRLIGFVGRLAKQKRLTDLVWAFQLLHQVVDDEVALVLIGDGPERDSIAEFASGMDCREMLYFAGHRGDASDIVSELDVCCLPSEFEGMSNSLMEAMSQGVPVVVSDIPANLELVTPEKTGLTFPLGDSPALAKAVKRLLTDRPLAQSVAESAAKLIAEHYSVEQLIERHIELYQRLLEADSVR